MANINFRARRCAVVLRNQLDLLKHTLSPAERGVAVRALTASALGMADLWYTGSSPGSLAQRRAFMCLATGDAYPPLTLEELRLLHGVHS